MNILKIKNGESMIINLSININFCKNLRKNLGRTSFRKQSTPRVRACEPFVKFGSWIVTENFCKTMLQPSSNYSVWLKV